MTGRVGSGQRYFPKMQHGIRGTGIISRTAFANYKSDAQVLAFIARRPSKFSLKRFLRFMMKLLARLWKKAPVPPMLTVA